MQDTLDIAGPAGPLEALLDRPIVATGRLAVLAHPHPLYGGSMHDGVLDCTAGVLLDQGITTLRFNFRGVGGSAGSHDNGIGEVDDLLAIVEWVVATETPERVILAGYSFGSNVTWRAAHRLTNLDRVILIAPPIGMMPFEGPPPAAPVHAVYGDADDFIDDAAMAAWQGVIKHPIASANHFFAGAWPALSTAIANTLR